MKVIEVLGLTELNYDGFFTIEDYLESLNIKYLHCKDVFIIDDPDVDKLNLYEYIIVVHDNVKDYLA
jgi:sugar phosphate isomerase/epimerase